MAVFISKLLPIRGYINTVAYHTENNLAVAKIHLVDSTRSFLHNQVLPSDRLAIHSFYQLIHYKLTLNVY